MQSDVARLVGCALIDIKVGMFHVDFVFLSDALTTTIRINKKFDFAVGKDEGSFDPTLEVHDPSVESSKFVFLHGMKCQRAALDRVKFEMAFGHAARLWVELGAKDFEPLHLIGASGERHEKLQFHHVL